MTPSEFLEKIRAAVADDPGLMNLTVIRMAIRDLENGGSVRDALYRIRVDLDKINYGISEEFGRYCQHAVNCLSAYDVINEQNKITNDGRGSSTARAICLYLERFDLSSARTTYCVDGDKVRQYPKLLSVIESTIIGCRLHVRPYHCTECFNKR